MPGIPYIARDAPPFRAAPTDAAAERELARPGADAPFRECGVYCAAPDCHRKRKRVSLPVFRGGESARSAMSASD